MAPSYWLVAATLTVVALSYAIPWLLAEVFPWRNLYNQRHGRPTPTTDSYKGRTFLITGANGAFGSRAAKIVAHRDVETLVLVDVRDCGALKAEIEAELLAAGKAAPNVLVWQVDLMTFAGCQALGQKAAAELQTLDHVLLTAGILSFARKESPEGWETSIQVNFLSNALVALLLLPLLRAAPSNPHPPVLTFVTTFSIWPASPTMRVPARGSYLRHLSNNRDGLAQKNQYGRSKGLLLYFARELAHRARGVAEVTVNSADPGSSWTPLTSANKDMFITRVIMDFGARDPQVGATALVNGASSGADAHGKIMMDFDTGSYPPFMERKSGKLAQQRVWDETRSELVGKVPEVKSIYDMLDGK